MRLPTPGERGLFVARIAAGLTVAFVAATWLHRLFASATVALGAIP